MKQSKKFGTHSDTHPHVNNLSYEDNVKELQESTDKIKKITGVKTNLYRAPYGEYCNKVIQAANDNNYFTIQWNLDTLDYTGITGNQMWDRLKDKMAAGNIILMHNGTKHTADSLEMLIKSIKEKGFNIVPISELIYKDNYYIDVNGTQIKNQNE